MLFLAVTGLLVLSFNVSNILAIGSDFFNLWQFRVHCKKIIKVYRYFSSNKMLLRYLMASLGIHVMPPVRCTSKVWHRSVSAAYNIIVVMFNVHPIIIDMALDDFCFFDIGHSDPLIFNTVHSPFVPISYNTLIRIPSYLIISRNNFNRIWHSFATVANC